MASMGDVTFEKLGGVGKSRSMLLYTKLYDDYTKFYTYYKNLYSEFVQ